MYTTSRLRKRLDRLRRRATLPEAPRPAAAPRRYGRRIAPPALPRAEIREGPARFATVVPGRELPAPGGGAAWLVSGEAPLPELDPHRIPPGTLFFDIEATGLTGVPLFLIGVMERREDRLRIRQYLARDYSEEGAVIALFLADARRSDRLVSFNGRSYDLPFIRARAGTAGLPFTLDVAHLDLLHPCRREFGGDLPNCRLVTLEARVLGLPRTGDIPGGDIPDAYHAFVHTGDARDLARIVSHNRLDLVSMAELLVRLPE